MPLETIERGEVQVFSRCILSVGLVLVTSCQGASRDYGQLVAHTAWRAVSASQDPFAEHRPDVITCPDYSYRVEGQGDAELFEVETDQCNYVTLVQDALLPTRAGDAIEIVLWHLNLIAAQEAQAHVALQLGSELLWEQTIDIPGAEAMYTPVVTLSANWPTGTPVYLHLHNHGANSWRFLTLAVRENP
tara:strand:- start:87 stop:653 length:567 start_codon:yes stop_codon:yes gene_type:complete